MVMKYNKLVRDRIPEIIKNNGEEPITTILSDSEYKIELEKKLFEEYNEVINASGKNRIEELADMLEVISALAALEGENLDNVIEVAKQKVLKRGAFNDKIYLEGVKKKTNIV
ncbi:MAG: phosphoribosyl-ATP pyrophosphohydrolase [Firmicutes bacterium]|nr:phosphoribosyl-ATP pyrophosphohydrolase [Bacillota bacterium]